MQEKVANANKLIETHREQMLRFFREIVAIPSMDSDIEAVGERVAEEMRKLGFQRVWYDKMGNIIGEIGNGPKKLLYDSHLDTVGLGDPDEWDWDPFEGKLEDGILYARGACDEKASTPGMIYGLVFAYQLGLLDGFTGYYFGNMEEWNEGSACQAFVETENIVPDYVVIGEPTNMKVYRGQKGRLEVKIVAKGKSSHAAANHLGDNAIYKLVPIIDAIRNMNDNLPTHDFLGEGRITVTDIDVKTASINAVPSEATIYVDRRMTYGETNESVIADIQAIIGERDDIYLEVMTYEEPSYTGFILPLDKVYPTWLFAEDDPFVQAGLRTQSLLNASMETGKWNFSTNGIYWAGKKNIPSIGFGPGHEEHAHTVLDQVRLEDVVQATAFYTLLPAMIKDNND